MAECLKKIHGSPSSLHTAGRNAWGIVDNARKSVSSLLGCGPCPVIFTSGGTEANNEVIKGVINSAGGGQELKMQTGTEGVHQIAGLGAAAELADCNFMDAGVAPVQWEQTRIAMAKYSPGKPPGLMKWIMQKGISE